MKHSWALPNKPTRPRHSSRSLQTRGKWGEFFYCLLMQVGAIIRGNERLEFNERSSEYSAARLFFCVDLYNRGKARKGLGACRIVRGIDITQLTLCYAHVNSSPLLVRGCITNRKNVCSNPNTHEKYVRSEASVAATQDTGRVHVQWSQLLIGTIWKDNSDIHPVHMIITA